MVMSDVKEEEVVNRITKLAAELHFSGDRSSISGMKGSHQGNRFYRQGGVSGKRRNRNKKKAEKQESTQGASRFRKSK